MEANDLNLVGCVHGHGIQDVQSYLVAQCETWKDATRLCMALSHVKRSSKAWAAILGITPGTLSMILNESGERKRKLDPDEINTIQRAAGNRAISQWMDLELRGLLNHQNDRQEKINELRAELALLEGKSCA